MLTTLGIIGTVLALISGAIYSYTPFKTHSIWVLFVALVAYMFMLCWFLQGQVIKNTDLTKPRFSEKVSDVSFSLGEGGLTSAYKTEYLKNPKEPFNLGGYKPVKLYINTSTDSWGQSKITAAALTPN